MENEEKTSSKKTKRILTGVVFLLLLAVAASGYWFYFVRGLVFSNDARMDGDLLDLAPQIGGRLIEVNGNEGSRVRAGDVLFALDRKSLEAVLARAEADEKSAQADLLVAEAQYTKALRGPRPEEIRVAEAAEQRAATSLKLARDNWNRIEKLSGGNAVSRAEMDKAQTAFEEAQKFHEQAVDQLRMLRQGSRQEDLDAAKAGVETRKARLAGARAALQQARVNLDFTVIRAPFDGMVARKWVTSGAVVQPGTPVLTLFNPGTLHVSANIDEKKLGRIAVDDTVDISVDAYPDLKLKGRIEKIMPATNSEFSLIPSEGVSGTYIKVTQRVPIRIAFNCPSDLTLGPGLSVEVSIHTGENQRSNHE